MNNKCEYCGKKIDIDNPNQRCEICSIRSRISSLDSRIGKIEGFINKFLINKERNRKI